jgi:hypothetical protein
MRTPVLDPAHAPAPLRGHPVDLVVAGGWRLPVRVQDTSAQSVTVESMMGDVVMPGGVTSCEAALEWRSARGLVRRAGRLSVDGRHLVLSGAEEAVIMQRRNYARVHCAVRVAVAGVLTGDDLLTRTVDLSVGGMLIEQAAVLGLDTRVRFSILLPDHGELQGEGTIVRATQFGHRAVQFDELSRADERLLARFVMAQEREGRSAAAYAAVS